MRFIQSVLLAIVVLCAPTQSRADYTNLHAELKPSKLRDFKPPISLFTQGAVTPFKGTYGETISIPVPPARNGFRPSIVLSYDSDRGATPFGYGWDLQLPRITRSLEEGVPRYIGPASQPPSVQEDTFLFELAGRSGRLVRVGPSGGYELYRPQKEGIFAKFYYETSTDSWRVKHQDGRVWMLGTGGAKDANNGLTYGWYAETVTDASDNAIVYSYALRLGVLRVLEIRYDHHTSFSTFEATAPRITFQWAEHPLCKPMHISYVKGYRAELDGEELTAIIVKGYDETTYGDNPGPGGETHFIQHTHAFTHQALDTSLWRRLTKFQPQSRPQASYAYTPPPAEFRGASSTTMVDPHPGEAAWADTGLSRVIRERAGDYSMARQTSRLVDLDGDGDLDLLYVDCPINEDERHSGYCKWWWRENRGNAWATEDVEVQWPPEWTTGLWPGWCGEDRRPACKYGSLRVAERALGITDWPHSGGLAAKRERVLQDLRDMDGDGLADIVYVDGRTQTVGGITGTFADVVVCPNLGGGVFGSCYVWWTNPRQDEVYLSQSYELAYQGKSQTWREAGFLDFDGDGSPDYVRVDLSRQVGQPGGAGWLVYTIKPASTKTQLHHLDAAACIDLPYSLPISCLEASNGIAITGYACPVRKLSDFNGDRIPDLWLVRPSSVGACATDNDDVNPPLTISLGTGRGFDGSTALRINLGGWPLESTAGWKVSGYDAGAFSEIALADVNGDGRPDMVLNGRFCSGVYDATCVRYNTGYGFADTSPFGWVKINTAYSRGLANTSLFQSIEDGDRDVTVLKTGFVDLDGDGMVDFVQVQGLYPLRWYGDWPSDTPWQVTSLGGGESFENEGPYKLRSRYGGMGFRTVTYTRPAEEDRPSMPKWVPARQETWDYTTQQTRPVNNYFRGAKYDRLHKEFAGFGTVEVTTPANRTITEYHQDFERRGLPQKTTRSDLAYPTGQKRVETTNTWNVVMLPPADLRSWARLASSTTVTYDGDQGQHTTTKSTIHTYDDSADRKLAGLLLTTVQKQGLPDNDDPDARTDTFDYFVVPTTDPDRVFLRSKVRTDVDKYTHRITEQSSESYLYDTQCFQPGDSPSRGLLCRKTVVRGSGLQPAEHNFQYDELGRRVTATNPSGVTVAYTYHRNTGFVATTRGWNGQPSEHLVTYYSDIHPLTGSPGKTCGPQYLTSPESDKCSTVKRDDYGRPLEIWEPQAQSFGTYLNAKVKQFAYQDYFGGTPPYVEMTAFPDPLGTTGTNAPARTTRVYYNGFGETVQEVQGGGNYWIRNAFAYDDTGRLQKSWLPWASSAQPDYIVPSGPEDFHYSYDSRDRLTRVTHAGIFSKNASYEGAVLKVIDEVGNERRTERNIFGEAVKVVSVAAPWGDLTRTFTYDGAGRLIEAEDASNGKYVYALNQDGTLRSTTLPTGATWTFTRRPDGKVTRRVDSAGGEVLFEYDPLGRLFERQVMPVESDCAVNRPKLETFVYGSSAEPDNFGRLLSVTGTRYTRSYDYDVRGNVSRSMLEDTEQGRSVEVQSTWNALGQKVVRRGPSGDGVVTTFDALGRPANVATESGSLDASIGYYLHGRPESVYALVTGDEQLEITRWFSYDNRQRLDTASLSVNQQGDYYTTYGYRNDGLLQSMSDEWRNVSYSWVHDGAARLTQANGYASPVNGWPQTFTFDYKPNGALDVVREDGASTTYVYQDAQHQQLAYTVAGSAQTTYTYSPAGARCTKQSEGSATTYRWTGDGRLGEVFVEGESGSAHERYYYDSGGQRWKRETASGITLYHEGVELDVDTDVVREYVSLPWMKCRLPGREPARCYISDQLNVVGAIDEDGSTPWKLSYAPYGREITIDGSPTDLGNRFGFNGHSRELDGGLLYFGARHYDPASRVFLSPDPLRLVGVGDFFRSGNTLQPFTFAASDPITHRDYRGLEPLIASCGKYDLFGGVEFQSPWRGFELFANAPVYAVNAGMNAIGVLSEFVDGVASFFGIEPKELNLLPGVGLAFGSLRTVRGARFLSRLSYRTTKLRAMIGQIAKRVSQKQFRHVLGRKEYRGGSYFKSRADAQKVLDAYHAGAAPELGKTSRGHLLIKYHGVTGTNVNRGKGIAQPTNVFMIKGTKSPSVVPTNPLLGQ